MREDVREVEGRAAGWITVYMTVIALCCTMVCTGLSGGVSVLGSDFSGSVDGSLQ